MDNLPKHIAIIPDGNRRWARAHNLPTLIGHQKGYDAFEPIIEHAIKRGIPYLTFWAFSTENWNRTLEEVNYLLGIFRKMFASDALSKLQKNNVKLKIIGDIQRFPKDIAESTAKIVDETRNNTAITVQIGLSYGGRQEILQAVNRLIADGKQDIDEEMFSSYLYSSGIPDPDLIIRTSGEQRLSGFMPWQTVYSEIYFTDVYWPDFTPGELDRAIEEYQRRERRMGK